MYRLEGTKKKKKITIDEDELLSLVIDDKDEAERYFNENIADAIITRYTLLHSNKGYYRKKFEKLSESCDFSSTDVKDVVEWMMPSFTEVYFGSDRIVGIFGRTPDDDPTVLEKIIKYQLQTQNNGYLIIDQWVRDAVEAGLGVVQLEWDRRDEVQKNWYIATAEEFYSIPTEIAERSIKKVVPLEDGTYKLLIREIVRVKDQPVLQNVMPGEYFYLPEKDENGRLLFEGRREYVPFDEIARLGKLGIYKNVDDDFPFHDAASSNYADSMDDIYDAITNYQGEGKLRRNDRLNTGAVTGQEGRKMVRRYTCFGQYDVDGDGLLETVKVVFCNGVLLQAEIYEYSHNPFFTISIFANSYQLWKQAVADYIQDIQDLKTALIRQIIINTALNNNRVYGVDASQPDAIADITAGKQMIRVSLSQGGKVTDVLQALPQFQLSPETMPLLEIADSWRENRTGITRYNQGLDAESLNKTATGINRIMAASQQRLRKMARDGAETGIVPLHKHLIELDKNNLDQEFVFRITNQFFEFKPDDIKGEYDAQVVSNIGLQDKSLTIQNLIFLFTQVLPVLMQSGLASQDGMLATARQIIEEMGFSNADKFIGQMQAQMQNVGGATPNAQAMENVTKAMKQSEEQQPIMQNKLEDTGILSGDNNDRI